MAMVIAISQIARLIRINIIRIVYQVKLVLGLDLIYSKGVTLTLRLHLCNGVKGGREKLIVIPWLV